VFILVGTNKENIESAGVRNEWSRYISRIKDNFDTVNAHSFFPVFKGMDIADMPKIGNRIVQGIDANKIGFLKNIADGAARIISPKKSDSVSDIAENVIKAQELVKQQFAEGERKRIAAESEAEKAKTLSEQKIAEAKKKIAAAEKLAEEAKQRAAQAKAEAELQKAERESYRRQVEEKERQRIAYEKIANAKDSEEREALRKVEERRQENERLAEAKRRLAEQDELLASMSDEDLLEIADVENRINKLSKAQKKGWFWIGFTWLIYIIVFGVLTIIGFLGDVETAFLSSVFWFMGGLVLAISISARISENGEKYERLKKYAYAEIEKVKEKYGIKTK
jgi:chromosome segregation ATPase